MAAKIPVVNRSPLQFRVPPPTGGFKLSPISCTEVSEILDSLKNSAPGYDNLSAELLKVVSDVTVKQLTHIFNLSFCGIVLQELKMASGNIYYRPISILTSISKILEKLVYNRLLNYLDKNEILYKHQYGLRKYRLYMSITHLTNELYRAIDSEE